MQTLEATGTEIGILNAARWLPYLLFGLLAGVVVDRYRRKPLLVSTDLGRAVVLAIIPISAAYDVLTLPLLIAVVLVFGALSLVYDAAHQSFPPSLVPAPLLTSAYARLEQTSAVAQTGGPVVAGALIKLIGAPLAIFVDAVSYLVSGVLLATLRTAEPEAKPAVGVRNVRGEIRDGLSWVYRNSTLGPLALTSHLWFVCQGMITTIYVLYVLNGLGRPCARSTEAPSCSARPSADCWPTISVIGQPSGSASVAWSYRPRSSTAPASGMPAYPTTPQSASQRGGGRPDRARSRA